MNIDKLKKKFTDEDSCRHFFESVIWVDGRKCPHCQCTKSYLLKAASVRSGTYECARCKRQFTVTTKTPMHSTKLSFWKRQTENVHAPYALYGQTDFFAVTMRWPAGTKNP